MALDLSVNKSQLSATSSPTTAMKNVNENGYSMEEEEDDNNNTMMSAINLSIPKERGKEEAEPQLSPQQIQLDIAALNLLCLARLQETAAVLTGRRPLPAHLNTASSFPLVNSNNNRRNHR